MKLVVGLGNPGEDYKKTRHNAGFRAVELCAEQHGAIFKEEKKFVCQMARTEDILWLKPQTFMNNSGDSIAAAARFYKITPEETLIVYDDKDMIFGKVRFREKGSSGGHRGMKSVIDALGSTDIPRIKIGVDSPLRIENDLTTAEYVLKKFSKEEEKMLKEHLKEVAGMIDEWLISC